MYWPVHLSRCYAAIIPQVLSEDKKVSGTLITWTNQNDQVSTKLMTARKVLSDMPRASPKSIDKLYEL